MSLWLESGKTMTVAELKAELNKYPDNIPVIATWEGVMVGINADDFRVKCVCNETYVIIDVDQN